MKYIAIVVTYNRLSLLQRCVKNLLEQTKPFYKIFVVDNGSDDGTFDYLKSISSDIVRCVHMEKNCGGTGGFYAGMQEALKAESDFFVLLDDDAILDKEFCKNIDNATKIFMDCKAFTGTVITNGTIDTSHRLKLSSKLFSLYKEIPIREYEKEYFECDFLSFCGAVINTNLIKCIGLPKEEYFIWYDDMEYSCRIREKTKIVNVNNSKVDHCRQIVENSEKNWRLYYGVRNRFDMVKCHMGRIPLILLYIRTFCVMLQKYMFAILKDKSSYMYIADCYRDGLKDAMNGITGKRELYSN